MKKSLTWKIISMIIVSEIYWVLLHFASRPVGLHAWIKSFGDHANIVSIFVQEIPIIIIWLLLNKFVWKQKILLRKYAPSKSIGILGFAIFEFLVGLSAIFRIHVSIGTVAITFVATILIGFAEDFLFRGLIFGSLISEGKSVRFSLIVSSVLFGLWHTTNIFSESALQTFYQVLYVMPIGVFLAVIYMKSNNLIYPILTHAMIDFNSIVNSHGQVASTSSTALTVLGNYLLFLTISLAFLYTGRQQTANFVAFLQDRPATLIRQSLPKLARNVKFRNMIAIATLVYSLLFIGIFSWLNTMQRATGSVSTIPTTYASLIQITTFLGIALYLFLVLFFNYHPVHILWWLIPFAGAAVFAVLVLTNAYEPRKVPSNLANPSKA